MSYWSFSRISTYRKCPYKYYLKYIRKIYIYKPNNNFVIGNAFGEFVEEWGKNPQLSLEEALSIYWKCCMNHKYKDNLEELKYLSYLVKQYYQQNKRISPLIINGEAAVEHQIKFKIADIIFGGAIDIIDENQGLLDYKTSKKIYTMWDLDTLSDKGLQLMIYSLGFLREFKKIPSYIGFQVIVKDNPVEVQKLTRKIYKADLIKTRDYLEKIINKILTTKSFVKNKTKLCDYCDYAGTYCIGKKTS